MKQLFIFDSTYVHDLDKISIGGTPVPDICKEIGEGPKEGRIYYNTIQCGHGPEKLEI